MSLVPPLVSRLAALPLALAASCLPAAAQEAQTPHLSIELNALAPAEGGCTLSFLAENRLGADLERAVYEAVLFDKAGQVDRLTLFDFADLPDGRPRVRQFVVPELACDGLGRILINGAHSCSAGALGAAACTDALDLSSRTDVEVVG